MTRVPTINELIGLRNSAILAVEQIEAVIAALDACGDAYAHFDEMFARDLTEARAHLARCEATLMAAFKDTP